MAVNNEIGVIQPLKEIGVWFVLHACAPLAPALASWGKVLHSLQLL
jgi:cysteine sulfinate desulfinase/cysteine desulfurase-like protein